MTIYAWPPTWLPSRFEMRVLPNTRTFVGPYTPTTQIIDLLGERWTMNFDLPQDSDPILGGAREAFFDRLKGPANQIALWNLIRPQPQGTLRGTPTLTGTVAQLANIIAISTTAGATLRAGDHIGIAGQVCRVMADVTADGTGAMASVEVQPRMRNAVAAGAAITWYQPTANFMLKAEGVPTTWRVGRFDGATLDLIEVY